MIKTAAQIIRDYREGHGMSQVYVGKRAGIDPTRISQWECGYVRIPADDFLRLIEYGFGVPLAVFFAEQLSKNENTERAEPETETSA